MTGRSGTGMHFGCVRVTVPMRVTVSVCVVMPVALALFGSRLWRVYVGDLGLRRRLHGDLV